jgi:hypothetical protein
LILDKNPAKDFTPADGHRELASCKTRITALTLFTGVIPVSGHYFQC